MALKIQGHLLKSIFAVVLFLSPGAAWGQPAETWETLEGKWCDAGQGCTHWWNAYEVEVRGNHVITIRHRDRRFLVFSGTIEKPGERWKIEGKWTNGPNAGHKFEAAVSEADDLKEIVQGKIKGSVTAKIQAATIEGIGAQQISEGGRQVEISIPIQISEATIEGIARPKKDKGNKEETAEDDEEGRGKKRMELKGEIKGKIITSAGPGDLKGDFTGKFTAVVQAVIKGTYRVPPPPCSEAGRALSKEEFEELKTRFFKAQPNFQKEYEDRKTLPPFNKEPGRLDDLLLDVFATKEGDREQRPGRSRWQLERGPSQPKRKSAKGTREDTEDMEECGVTKCIVIEAGKTKVPRPTGPNTRGKFTREVSGTVNAIKPRTITIDLPPLPVLDYKCSVIDEVPKRTLKLVKQHDELVRQHDE
jgi:hypothetical protein